MSDLGDSRERSVKALQSTVARRGRPKSLTPHATVSTWLPADTHDRLIQIANRREMSVSALVRRVLVLSLR